MPGFFLLKQGKPGGLPGGGILGEKCSSEVTLTLHLRSKPVGRRGIHWVMWQEPLRQLPKCLQELGLRLLRLSEILQRVFRKCCGQCNGENALDTGASFEEGWPGVSAQQSDGPRRAEQPSEPLSSPRRTRPRPWPAPRPPSPAAHASLFRDKGSTDL